MYYVDNDVFQSGHGSGGLTFPRRYCGWKSTYIGTYVSATYAATVSFQSYLNGLSENDQMNTYFKVTYFHLVIVLFIS